MVLTVNIIECQCHPSSGEVLIRVPAKMLVSMGNVLKDAEFIQFCHGSAKDTSFDFSFIHFQSKNDIDPNRFTCAVLTVSTRPDASLHWFIAQVIWLSIGVVRRWGPGTNTCVFNWRPDLQRVTIQSLPLQAKVFPLTTRAHCAKIAKKLTRFTRDEFLWAQCCVVTRNFLGLNGFTSCPLLRFVTSNFDWCSRNT